MNDTPARIIELLRQARSELEKERLRRSEPIAVVGIGCRFPGDADSAEDYFRLLSDGVDGIRDVPPDRWNNDEFYDPDPEAPGKLYTRGAGFLRAIDGFDPAVFGIAPREAVRLDPQQRLLLELSWEALEDAGLAPLALGGSRTGVWVGLTFDDYAKRNLEPPRIDAYGALGNSRSVAAGRISYTFGFHGPTLQLDTACSSSLVAVHLACQSLRAGECDRALAGGANLIIDPEPTIALCKLRALSPDSRCRTFDAGANGYARGEGGGVVVLERLSDALARRARIYGVVAGSAVNHDGRSNGLTAPNGSAQENVLREALQNANLEPHQVGLVESHGTGTPLGDPIEVMALARVLGRDRGADNPLYLGAVKTNFGHLEGAAGIAGFIKAVLCVGKGRLVPNLNFETPNPRIPWTKHPLIVPTRAAEWSSAGPRVAGVSAFGISGTNAHVLITEGTSASHESAAGTARAAELIVVSGQSAESLAANAARLQQRLTREPIPELRALSHQLIARRSPAERRFSVAVRDIEELSRALGALGQASEIAALVPTAQGTPPPVVFVFPGQGSQWLGMGRELMRDEPVFRRALERCDEAIRKEAGWSLLSELAADDSSSHLSQIAVVQPTLFAMQVALAELWRSLGVEPAAVVGHSMGEIAASHVAGALDLESAVAVICRRSRLLERISGRGEMAVVELSLAEAEAELEAFASELSVAVSNASRSTVISGEPGALGRLLDRLEQRGVFCRRVRVDVASHSPQVEPLLPDLRRALAGLRSHPPAVPIYSTVTGALLGSDPLDPDYWARNLREPVRFAEVVRGLLERGAVSFVELSPHPVLNTAIEALRQELGAAQGTSIASLKREAPERLTLLEGLGKLHEHGQPLIPERLFPSPEAHVDVPTYAWNRRRFWVEREPGSRAGTPSGHPLLGRRIEVGGFSGTFESWLSLSSLPWLADHRVRGQIVVPGAAIAELFRAAFETIRNDQRSDVVDLVFLTPLLIEREAPTQIQVLIDDGDRRHATLYARVPRPKSSTPPSFELVATARFEGAKPAVATELSLDQLRQDARHLDAEELYGFLERSGLEYGPAFRGVRELWVKPGEVLGRLQLDDALEVSDFGIHPALLDSALHCLAPLLDARAGTLLPFEVGAFTLHGLEARAAWAHARLRPDEPSPCADVSLRSSAGALIAELKSVRLRAAPERATPSLELESRETHDVYRVSWLETPPPAPSSSLREEVWICSTSVQTGRELADRIAGVAPAPRVVAVDALRSELEKAASPPRHLITEWQPEATPQDAIDMTTRALELLQGLGAATPRLWWLTRGAAGPEGEVTNPWAAPLWGLGRTVQQERPELRLTLVDIGGDEAVASVFSRELGALDAENQVVWRSGKRLVPRLVESPLPTPPASENAELLATSRGDLSTLTLQATERRAPGPGEVEIEVAAAGLNFRDVLIGLGAVGEAPLGAECSGTVRRLGPGVTDLALDDLVLALCPACVRRFVTVNVRSVMRVPKGLSRTEAAGIPVVFVTAWQCLKDLARLSRGERVLIHAAAGGVGMAAVQVARQLGAEVFATAHPSKWELLRELGVQYVGSSRDTSFASDLQRLGGVDVVLNSLTGALIDAGLSALRPGGRFIEIGKLDIRDAGAIAARYPDIQYRVYDLASEPAEAVTRALGDVVEGFRTKLLEPLPYKAFDWQRAEVAFRLMARGVHTGKLILQISEADARPETVWITGGLGGLGAEIARSYARRGTPHLLLTGRKGVSTPGAAELVRELESHGSGVSIAAVDVTDPAAMRAALASIPSTHPLGLVVHAAAVLDDGLLAEQTPQRFERVLAPKLTGLFYLHELTRELPRCSLISFSSLSGVLGSAGQGAYAAANAFLDAFSVYRASMGLAGCSLAWGPWSQTGLASELGSSQRERLTRQGIGFLQTSRGLELFHRAHSRGTSALVVVPLDRDRVRRSQLDSIAPMWRALIRPIARADMPASDSLAELAPGERINEIGRRVKLEIARVLSLGGSAAVPDDVPLRDLGMDSLTALELRNALARHLSIPLPATLVFDHPTAKAIATYLSSQIRAGSAATLPIANVSVIAQDDPIAVIGMGCRFPGNVTTPEELWQLLVNGTDAITEVPQSRWSIDEWYDPNPDAPGKIVTRWGGYLDGIENYDAAFFGISALEAKNLDPQGRLVLETAWEALERAGLTKESLEGSRTGVYIGICGTEYQSRAAADVSQFDAYSMLGTMHSAIVGRLSYWLGLQGPNMPIDTACSSSLVAVHLACQALRAGECNLAMAGGTNVLLGPEPSVYFSRLGALSPTGRCRAFSAEADGFVRAEGAGVIVLERLSDALAARRTIIGVIRGSAVNQDGRSNGLTAPSGPAQEKVIRDALSRSKVQPHEICFVECHGTGTELGDPIEVQALAAALGERRDPTKPILLGSLKSNVGHMEGAAGIGGLIKALLAVNKGYLPRTLHTANLNPHIDWQALPVRVTREPVVLDEKPAQRFAGVSSFGISGTNAHVVIQGPPDQAPTDELGVSPRSAELFVLSAKTHAALRAMARGIARHLEDVQGSSLASMSQTLLVNRSAMQHRLAFTATSLEELTQKLREAGASNPSPAVVMDQPRRDPGRLTWVFSGQGGQRLGMGRELHSQWPAFRDAFDRACEAIDKHLQHPLKAVMWAGEGDPLSSLLNQTEYTQPALFALQWGLAALWRSVGVLPDVVMGHSVGEIAAATVAGCLSLEDAARLVSARGHLMQTLCDRGAMVSIAASPEELRLPLEPWADAVEVAAFNAPRSTVIAGDERAAMAVAEHFASKGVRVRRLEVSHAFHSRLMEPMLPAFRRVIEGLQFQPPRQTLVSCVTGQLAGREIAQPEYWVEHVRKAVAFKQGLGAARAEGSDRFLELGPRGTLVELIAETLGIDVVQVVASARPRTSETESALQALGQLWVRGARVESSGLFPERAEPLALPTYPYQRSRFWIERPAHERAPAQAASPFIEGLNPSDLEAELPPEAKPHASSFIAALRALDERRALHARVTAWFHHTRWQARPLPARSREANTKYVVWSTGEPLGELVRSALSALGYACQAVESIEELTVALRGRPRHEPARVLALLPRSSPEQRMLLARSLLATDSARFCWLTRGAVRVTGDETALAPEQATAWGMGRTLALELPQTWGGLIDITPEIDSSVVSLIATVLVGTLEEDEMAIRHGRVHTPRLMRDSERAHLVSPWTPHGTALITGGLGGLGFQVARWLASRGVRDLLLTNRRGPETPGARDALSELERMGARPKIAAADVCDERAMSKALSNINHASPLRFVFHAAGLADRTRFVELTPQRLQEVIAAKREGTEILDRLTAGVPLTAFVCFSSIAAVWGAGEQAAYAAANAFQNAFALDARRRGRPAWSISWGPWSGVGMLTSEGQRQLERRGVMAMPPEAALAALDLALRGSDPTPVIAHVDWSRLRPSLEVWRRKPLLEFLNASEGPAAEEMTEPTRLSSMTAGERDMHLRALLMQQVARALSVPESDIDPDAPLLDQGVDSLLILELRSALNRTAGVQLSRDTPRDQLTISGLVRQVSGELSTNVKCAAADCRRLNRPSQPRKRLFCFHDAGGSGELFAPFAVLERRGIEVHTISIARTLPPEHAAPAYLDAVCEYVRSHSDLPYGVFGHSVGGLLAWAVIRRLALTGSALPSVFAPSAVRGPKEGLSGLAESDLDATLRRLWGGRAEELAHFRKDFTYDVQVWQALSQSESDAPALHLKCRAFVGAEDPLYSEQDIRTWASMTTGAFSATVLPGDHGYLLREPARDALLEKLAEEI